MINVNIFLFGKPEWMLDLEEAEYRDFEELGVYLSAWLKEVGRIVKKLEKSGWNRSAGLYDLHFSKDITFEDAKKELKRLKIGLKQVDLEEWDEEE
jgi:hypothetical protein